MTLVKHILTAGIYKKRIRNCCSRTVALLTKNATKPNFRRLGELTKSEKSFGVELDNLRRLETVNDFADFFSYSLYCQRLTKFSILEQKHHEWNKAIVKNFKEIDHAIYQNELESGKLMRLSSEHHSLINKYLKDGYASLIHATYENEFNLMQIPNEFYPSLEDTDNGILYTPRYKADESLLDLIVPITKELVECLPWLRMAGGGSAHRMYQIIYTRVIERPFFQMYKLAIAHRRFDILDELEQIETPRMFLNQFQKFKTSIYEVESNRNQDELHAMRLTTDEHLKLSQLLIEQHIKSKSYDDVIDALYRSSEILQRDDFEYLVRSTYYELNDATAFLKESLEDILRDDSLFHEIENYKKYQTILDSDVELSVADFRELLKRTLYEEKLLPNLRDLMNLECVKENHLISQLALSHYSDRYDLIERLFNISNLSESISYYKQRNNLHKFPDLNNKHHFHISNKAKSWTDESCDQMKSLTITSMNPVCPVSTLFNQKIDQMGILKNDSGNDVFHKESLDSSLIELIKNRVFSGMEDCTNVNKYKENLLALNKATALVTVQPRENPFRLTELDKRFQKGGNFEDIHILEVRSHLGVAENELTMINFPNQIQFEDEESFKNENNAEKLKRSNDGKRYYFDSVEDVFMNHEKMVFRYVMNRFRLSQKYEPEGNAMSVRDLFSIFHSTAKTRKQIIYALQTEVSKNPILLKRNAFVSNGTYFKLRDAVKQIMPPKYANQYFDPATQLDSVMNGVTISSHTTAYLTNTRGHEISMMLYRVRHDNLQSVVDECNKLTHILESENFTLEQCHTFFQMATHYLRPRYKMKLVKKLDPPLAEISNTLYAIFGLEVAKEDFIIREVGTRKPLSGSVERHLTEVKSTIPKFYQSTNEQIIAEFNQETKYFGETDREKYDREYSSLNYKKIEDNVKKYAMKIEQRQKAIKNVGEIRPLLHLQCCRLEFAMKALYETKIRNYLLLEKRKWEDFVFDLVKSKINVRQDPFEIISLFADCLSAQLFYFDNMEANLRIKYFVHKSIHCHRLLEYVLQMNYHEDSNVHESTTATNNYKNACNAIKNKYDLDVGDIFPSYGTSEQRKEKFFAKMNSTGRFYVNDLNHLLETEADEELDLLMNNLSTEWWVRVLLDSTKQIDGIILMKLIAKLLERGVIHEQTFKTLLYKMQPGADSENTDSWPAEIEIDHIGDRRIDSFSIQSVFDSSK